MNTARPWKKARLVNSSSLDFPAWVSSELLDASQFADPAAAAGRVITRLSVEGGGGVVPAFMQVTPYGLGADNDTFGMRLVGLRRIATPYPDGRFQFVRQLIATLNCTLSSAVGLAGGYVLETERFADTIAIAFEGSLTADSTRPTAGVTGPSAARLIGVPLAFRVRGSPAPPLSA